MRVPMTATTAAPAEMRNRFVRATHVSRMAPRALPTTWTVLTVMLSVCAPEDERFLGHDVRQQRDGRGEGGVHDGDEHEAHPPRQ